MSKKKSKEHTLDVCARKCGAECCGYLMVKVDPPKRRVDRDEHRWFLMHEGVELRIESREWYMLINTRCKNLAQDNSCKVYAQRPDLCEDYDHASCDSNFRGGPRNGTIVFKTVEEYDAYIAKRGFPWRPRKR